MPHKSGKKAYPAEPGHPGKGMPPKGMHKMPNGHMMSDDEMKKMMKKGGKK